LSFGLQEVGLERLSLPALWLCFLLILVGCGGAPVGDAERGRQLFDGTIVMRNGDTPSCASCHAAAVDEVPTLGLNLSNIGARAERRVAGMSAAEYLHESIVFPDAQLTGGWQEGIMYRGYGQDLTEQQIADLVAYLLTMRSGEDFGE
jgi:cytochrome c553